jgi:hypothetical protein
MLERLCRIGYRCDGVAVQDELSTCNLIWDEDFVRAALAAPSTTVGAWVGPPNAILMMSEWIVLLCLSCGADVSSFRCSRRFESLAA